MAVSRAPDEWDDLSPPAHLKFELPPTRKSLSDRNGRRIAHLLHLHPALDCEYRRLDLQRSTPNERAKALAEILDRLGIS